MERNVVRQRLRPIFQDVFDDPALELHDNMMAADVEGWDSLLHINLVVAVEKEFKIKLTTADVQGLNNVGDLIALISNKAS